MLFALISFFSCAKPVPKQTFFVLGTTCTINLGQAGTKDVYAECFSYLSELELVLSANRSDSNVEAINREAGVKPVVAHPYTLEVLTTALDIARMTNGAFDPTIGPLVKLWGIGTEDERRPSNEEIDEARALVSWKMVQVDTEAGTVYLPVKGMRLDLGAIAKGYAADGLSRLLSTRGVHRGIIDLGGNILTLGDKSPGQAWKIGIRDPRITRGGPVMGLPVISKTVVTSGIHERFFVENGNHWHHIIDPATGYPAQSKLLSVSIIGSTSMIADALSTSVFIMGQEKGLDLVQKFPDIEAILIDNTNKVYVSPGLTNSISILDTAFIKASDTTQ